MNKPKKRKSVRLTLDHDLHKQLRIRAMADEMTLANTIEQAIAFYLEYEADPS